MTRKLKSKNNTADPLVSIVIVNQNGMRWLPACLSSLERQEYKKIEVVVVDNNSNDASVSWIKSHFPNMYVIPLHKNEGYAQANNIGFASTHGEYVVFLNNDTKVTKTFLTALLQVFVNDSSIGGVQSKILLMDKPNRHDSVGALFTASGILYHFGFGKKNSKKYDHPFELYTAKGACMMFRKHVLQEITVEGNIFDADYFAYFEESDLCHRVWLSGSRIVYVPTSVIYHKMGATSKTMNNEFIQYHSYKNRIRTYMKNLGNQKLIKTLSMHLLLCQLYAFFSLVRGKVRLGIAIERAIFWNILVLGETIKLRRIVQTKIRRVTDLNIFSHVEYNAPLRYYIGLLQGKVYE